MASIQNLQQISQNGDFNKYVCIYNYHKIYIGRN